MLSLTALLSEVRGCLSSVSLKSYLLLSQKRWKLINWQVDALYKVTLNRIRKKSLRACFKVLSWHFLRKDGENNKGHQDS
jgi:hypothetical protein